VTIQNRQLRPPPSTGGRLVYAVGDIHGYPRQLVALLARIRADAVESADGERPLVVFLGDYVDRGPDSRAVIDLILGLIDEDAFEVVALKGNHEDALVRFLAEPTYAPAWIANWGQATLRAYGIALPSGFDVAACEAAQAQFVQALPDSHRAFLDRLELSRTVGDYLFVHAGVRPGVALAEQDPRDLIWIRYDFLESDADFDKVVVHGHTPADRPERKANRINVDTGVYFSGVLTAVRLQGESVDFLHAGAD
jgi:serine/threonine protein phosphatase 1